MKTQTSPDDRLRNLLSKIFGGDARWAKMQAVVPWPLEISLSDAVRGVLRSLMPREERVLRMKLGVGEKSEQTLEQIGQQFGVSKNRIQQIEAKAIRKLRHPSRSRLLKPFLEGASSSNQSWVFTSILDKPIDELEMSARAANCLKYMGVKTIGDLVHKTETEMLKVRNFGRKSLKEVKDILAGMGLRLTGRALSAARPAV